MIESVMILGVEALLEGDGDVIQVVFTDGTYVNLSEEELKNAAMLAEKGTDTVVINGAEMRDCAALHHDD